MPLSVARACGYVPDFKIGWFRSRLNRIRLWLYRKHVPGVKCPRIKVPKAELAELPGPYKQFPCVLPECEESTAFVKTVEDALTQSPQQVRAWWEHYHSLSYEEKLALEKGSRSNHTGKSPNDGAQKASASADEPCAEDTGQAISN